MRATQMSRGGSARPSPSAASRASCGTETTALHGCEHIYLSAVGRCVGLVTPGILVAPRARALSLFDGVSSLHPPCADRLCRLPSRSTVRLLAAATSSTPLRMLFCVACRARRYPWGGAP